MTNQAPIISLSNDRANYRRVERYMTQKTGGKSFIITAADLRLENPLSKNTNMYSFDLYENQGSDRPLEVKLNRNDIFFVTHVALNITKQDGVKNQATNHGNYPLFTYPDPQYFIGDDGTNPKEYEALYTLFNGKMTCKTNPVVRMKDFPTHNFLYIPESQMVKQAAPQINDEFPQYGPTHAARGFYELNPLIVFDGQDNNSIDLELGSGDKTLIEGEVDNANAAVTTRNVAVLLVKGFRVENGAQAAGRWVSSF